MTYITKIIEKKLHREFQVLLLFLFILNEMKFNFVKLNESTQNLLCPSQ